MFQCFLGGIDLDALCLGFCAFGLRHSHLQDSILERGFDLVFLDFRADRNAPLEPSIEAFAELALLVFHFGFLFAADGQNPVAEEDLHILLFHARNFRGHGNILVRRRQLDIRPGHLRQGAASGQSWQIEIAEGLVKQAIHLAVKPHDRAGPFVPEKVWHLGWARPRNEITYIHDFPSPLQSSSNWISGLPVPATGLSADKGKAGCQPCPRTPLNDNRAAGYDPWFLLEFPCLFKRLVEVRERHQRSFDRCYNNWSSSVELQEGDAGSSWKYSAFTRVSHLLLRLALTRSMLSLCKVFSGRPGADLRHDGEKRDH